MIALKSVRDRRDEILKIADQFGARDVRIFGSVVRNDAREDSDLDLVVRFDANRSLMDHAGLVVELEDLLGIKVDVIDADGMQPRFRSIVEKEAQPL